MPGEQAQNYTIYTHVKRCAKNGKQLHAHVWVDSLN